MAVPTQADVDKLQAALLGSGAVKSMEIAGQRYEFRDVADIQRVLAWAQQQVNAAAGTGSSRFAATSKGV